MDERYRISAKRRRWENMAVICVVILAVIAIISSISHFATLESFDFGMVEVHHGLHIILAIIMCIISWNLIGRSRNAWIGAQIILLLSIILNIAGFFYHTNDPVIHGLLVVFEVISFMILLICRDDFCRKPVRGKIGTLTDAQKKKARELVCKYGQNPCSYLTLEDDKTLFFGTKVEGVLPYGVVGDTVVVNGDPICAPEDFETFLSEFQQFCHDNIYSCIFLSVTDEFLEIYKKLGYGCVKCGEEPRFDVQQFTLKGGKMAKIRAEVNHAVKDGIVVKEYKPLVERNKDIEDNYTRITNEWLDGKKSAELIFTMGGVGFENPMDKRYFYAEDADGHMVGYIVYVPFAGMEGYMADVTRRAKDAPRGVMEMIETSAIEQFKEEGIKWVSLGLAPLAKLDEGEYKDELGSKLLHYVYEHLNNVYGFKSLFFAKQKYNPEIWEPGFYAFEPKVLTPGIGYAVVAIQNSNGVFDYVKAFFKNREK